jgi:polysaccharide pyruvyl transferase WcaK-like protein
VRIGIYGLFGSGNYGNDGSLGAALAFLRARHPDAYVECLCPGPENVTARFGIAASRASWYRGEYRTASNLSALVGKACGKVVDAFRILAWVRRFDAVLVPGSGMLEASLAVRPWDRPYALLLVCAAGRLTRTKVALVSVGATVPTQPATRWLFGAAARLAHYRSFRDLPSQEAVRTNLARAANDPVYPDLVFSLPSPEGGSDPRGRVGVGVMAYYGGNDDRARAAEVHANYLDKMQTFVRWLVDHDRSVLLFTGDRADETVAAEIVRDTRTQRPDLDATRVAVAPVSSVRDMMEHLASVETVVAARYHNVLCALKLAKPTLSIGYGPKNEALMSDMGLGEFCQSTRDLDVERLIEQLAALEARRDEVRVLLAERTAAAARQVDEQFTRLSDELLGSAAASTRR